MLLNEVVAAYGSIKNERQKEIIISAVRHLFAFANDVSLTREEWRAGIAYMRAVGEACTETRDEFILLSDVLGLSALVETVSGDPDSIATPGSLTGPFHVSGSPYVEIGGMINLDTIPGEQTVYVAGHVLDTTGKSIPDAVLDIWQTAPNRLYAVQDQSQSEFNLRGKQRVDQHGRYGFKTVRPVPYPIPRDGPVGKILEASKRHGMRAAHIHIGVEAFGYESLVTEIFDADDNYKTSDTVFGTCESLLANYKPNPDAAVDTDLRVDFDIILRPKAR